MHKQIKYYNVNFQSDGLLDRDVRESTFIIENDKSTYQEIFSHPIDVSESMHLENIFQIMCISEICTYTWKTLEFLSFTWVCTNNKKFKIIKLE